MTHASSHECVHPFLLWAGGNNADLVLFLLALLLLCIKALQQAGKWVLWSSVYLSEFMDINDILKNFKTAILKAWSTCIGTACYTK